MPTRLIADARDAIREQVLYRELLYQMTRRDLVLRYKQTLMGLAWAVFMPLVNTAVFSVIFVKVAPLDTGMPYPLFAYCGLLAWNLSASTFRFAVVSLTSNATLVTKVYFPREIFPFSAAIVSLVDFAVGASVLILMMVYYHVPATVALVALPCVVLVQLLFTVAVSLVLAMANLFYRDVKYLFELTLTIWMFTTSVLYPVSLVGGRTGRLLQLNVMTPIIEAYRDVLLRGRFPDMSFASAALVSVVLLAIAWLTFHRSEFTFAERM